MNVRRGGLGRGLGALIPTGPDEDDETGARFEELPLDSIEPNPRQPREIFDADALAELVASIQAVGVLQPVVVRELEPGRYQLIMGERRLRATRAAGLPVIPAIVRETSDDALLRDALLENLHRQQLNALEEAAAYQQLLEEFGTTHEELADRLGRSRSHVTNTLRLLQLGPAVQRRVAAGVLSAGHARALLSLDDHDSQDRLAARIVAEGLSVRAVEEIVALGDETTPRARTSRPRRVVAPALATLAELLSEQFETRVSVDMGRRRGKLVIEFASVDDLERIVSAIAPDAAGLLRGEQMSEDGTGADGPRDADGRREGQYDGQHDQHDQHEEHGQQQHEHHEWHG